MDMTLVLWAAGLVVLVFLLAIYARLIWRMANRLETRYNWNVFYWFLAAMAFAILPPLLVLAYFLYRDTPSDSDK